MPAISPLVSAAMSLRAASPSAWLEFLSALAGWRLEQTELMVQAPPDKLANMQGRAQAATALLKTLDEAPQTYDQHQRKS